MFYIYSLEYCPYSMEAEQIIKQNNLSHKIIKVKQEEKNKYKKLNKWNTFPQVFYKHKTNKLKLIGGCSDLEKYINIINIIKEENININILKYVFSSKKK
jgi:glutaredoxin